MAILSTLFPTSSWHIGQRSMTMMILAPKQHPQEDHKIGKQQPKDGQIDNVLIMAWKWGNRKKV